MHEFQSPPDDARVMMRWWWFGPAVTKADIQRELRAMKQGGIGGVEIQPVYPVAFDDAEAGIRNLPYLSDEHIEALRYANAEARALGLRVDLTLGSGWPFGGPTVPVTQSAARLRIERIKLQNDDRRVPVPSLETGEKLLAAFLTRGDGDAIDPHSTREVAVGPGGEVTLPDDRHKAAELLFFISSRTGQQVKRPCLGAEGFVLDHYDASAVQAYLQRVGDRLMEAFDDQPPYAVFCDSLEVYQSDWTPGFLEAFSRRRGYDLKPYLPALAAEFGPRTRDVRHDWGQTLTELLNENFIQPVRAWAARHGTRFRIQAYGVPPAALSTYRDVDLPEGEGYQWKILRASRWASSASHLYGRPVTSSETWTWLNAPSYRATPLDMKAEADLHFLQGINQLIGHGWPYSASGLDYPGWRFYASGAFNDQNPWWIVMPSLMKYLQRMSHLLRQGQPANDVAMYLPNSDAWAAFQTPSRHGPALIHSLRAVIGDDVVARTLEAGFNFDFFDDQALREVGKVEPAALALGPNRYKVVILPNVERLPIDTLNTLAEFARGGGILIATGRVPARAADQHGNQDPHGAVRERVHDLFSADGALGHFVTDVKAGLTDTLIALLRPDVAFSGNKTDLGFVHRRSDEMDIYFVANTSPTRCQVDATFRVQSSPAEWWDAFDGTTSTAPATPAAAGGVTVPMELEPYESRVVVFKQRSAQAPAAPKPPVNAGSLDLSHGWRISFPDGREVAADTLRCWTEDEATRYFSGVATYYKTFDLTEDWLQPAGRVQITFGPTHPLPAGGADQLGQGFSARIETPVREAAVVYVNGEQAGTVWRPPYRLDVGNFLRPGVNELRIDVGNTAINHLAGRPHPDYRLLNRRYGERFVPQGMTDLRPLPSGLMGPVRLERS